MKKRIILGMMLLLSMQMFAQNDILLTQQWFSRINRNPASTGNSDNLDLFFLTRQQWYGVEDSPKTNLLNVHNYFDGIRSGLGLSLYYDTDGLADVQMLAKLAYAYHLNINENMLLSLGVAAGVLDKSIDFDKHTLADQGEYGQPTFPSGKVGETHPDFDFGFELSTPRFLFGGSITHLGNQRDDLTSFTAAQHHYLYGRGNFVLDENFDLAPSIVYLNTGKVNMLTLGSMLFYKKMYWFGIDYRPPSPSDWKNYDHSTLTAMLGLEWNFLRVGYSYDLSLGKLNSLASSTHELMLSLRLAKKTKNNSIRFME